jgi:F0F1-type ATP synthase membrane subunit b/b'
MSDILDRLLGVEKDAGALVTETETEAARRKTQARLEAQKEHTRLIAEKAKELEARIDSERDRLKKERESKNAAFAGELRAKPLSPKELARVVLGFIKTDT